MKGGTEMILVHYSAYHGFQVVNWRDVFGRYFSNFNYDTGDLPLRIRNLDFTGMVLKLRQPTSESDGGLRLIQACHEARIPCVCLNENPADDWYVKLAEQLGAIVITRTCTLEVLKESEFSFLTRAAEALKCALARPIPP
jgi:hypothetical protein